MIRDTIRQFRLCLSSASVAVPDGVFENIQFFSNQRLVAEPRGGGGYGGVNTPPLF